MLIVANMISKATSYEVALSFYFVAIMDQKETNNTADKLISDGRHLHDICLCYRSTGEIFYEHLGYTYIDLTNFALTLEQCSSKLDKWFYHLKNLHNMASLPNGLEKTIFELLYSIAEYTKLSKEAQDMYDEALKRKWDNAAVMTEARESGEAIGEARGRRESTLEIARNLKSMNLDAESIIKATGLSQEEIENLYKL